MMIDGLVSVITPMYNAEKWIEETVRSVQAQSYEKWEMIIVDDCSSDHSAEIVKKLQKEDSRICYFRNEKNSGVAASRNHAISCAKGQYLAFLDSDDQWFPKKLEKQIKKLQKEDGAFCYSACEVIDGQGNRINVRHVPEKTEYKDLLKGNVIPCLTVLIDRKKIPKVTMPQIPHEDYAAWLKILQEGVTAWGVDEPLASYRECGMSVSSDKVRAMRWTWNIYRKFLGLGFARSCYCFFFYAVNALKKRKG